MDNNSLQITPKDLRAEVGGTPIGKGIVPATIEDATKIANALFQTGCFSDVKTAGQAVAKVIVGAEFGFPAVFSMMNVYLFNSNIGLEYPAMSAVIKAAGYSYKVLEQSKDACSIQFFNPDNSEPGPPARFTADDAKAAGTQNMGKFPQAMLFARALSMGCRMYCSDAFAGAVYSKDEIENMEIVEEVEEISGQVRTSERIAKKVIQVADDRFNPFAEDSPAPTTQPRADQFLITALDLTEEQAEAIQIACQGDVDYLGLLQTVKDSGATGADACYAQIGEWTGRMPL